MASITSQQPVAPVPYPPPLEVLCVGCGVILEVEPGLTEFVCPDCHTAQSLPPELMPRKRKALPLTRSVNSRKIQLPCGSCGVILSMPYGLSRFDCPECRVALAVDHEKLKAYLSGASFEAMPLTPSGVRLPPVVDVEPQIQFPSYVEINRSIPPPITAVPSSTEANASTPPAITPVPPSVQTNTSRPPTVTVEQDSLPAPSIPPFVNVEQVEEEVIVPASKRSKRAKKQPVEPTLRRSSRLAKLPDKCNSRNKALKKKKKEQKPVTYSSDKSQPGQSEYNGSQLETQDIAMHDNELFSTDFGQPLTDSTHLHSDTLINLSSGLHLHADLRSESPLHPVPVMSSGGGDSEPVSAKKPGRGPTKLIRVVNKSNKEVQFDKLGRPIINEQTTSYPTQLGILVRAQVSIRFKEWSEVPDLVKKKIWHEVKLAWNLPDNDDMKKNVYQRMAVAFRKFRNRLYNDYMKKDKTPFEDYTAITQEDWELFVKYHQSDEFEELSKIGRANQSNNMYPHFLGSRGYSGEKFQKRLKETLTEIASKEGSSSDLSSQGSTDELSQDQLVDMSVQHRHVLWKLARHKMSDGASVYPNPETEAMIKTIDEQQKAFDQGMMTTDGYDDILGNSLPNREHPGRVRGVGSLVGIKKTYKGCGKRKRYTSSEAEASIQERIQRKVEERMKPFLEQHETLMRQMTMLMGQQTNKGNPLVSSPKAVQSSCPLVQPPYFLDFIEEECKCKLHLVRDGQKIQVAVGTINPSLQGTSIHGRLMPPGHARVMVDDYVTGEDDTPVPVPVPNGEVETLRLVRSSFTAWPKDLISLDEVKFDCVEQIGGNWDEDHDD